MTAVRWLAAPQEHDYPAAAAYLSLLMAAEQIGHLEALWRAGSIVQLKARDILRAARLDLLSRENPHVASDLQKVQHKRPLSPILLVRGRLTLGVVLQVADGNHSVCASYLTDENTDIPCLIADPTSTPA